ncbi:MAG: FtsW/RodA/SpoVE family cell cycle protein [Ilumatobacter sp.]
MAQTTNVADRRRAALERLGHDDRVAPIRPRRQSTRARSGTRDRKRARRPSIGPAAPPIEGPPPGVWYGICVVTAVFVMLGLVMVLSASAVTEASRGNWAYSVFFRQAMWAGLGLLGLMIAARVPYTFWRRLSIPMAVLGVAAMLLPFAPVVGSTVNGARAWVRYGGVSGQPSELLKLVAVIVTADLLARRTQILNHRRRTLLPLAGIAAVASGLSMAQGDLGSAIVLASIVLSIAWIAGIPFMPLAAMASAATGAGLLAIMSSQARLDRFTAFLDVAGNKDRSAWQVYQGFVSIASGGMSGSGIGGSNTKLGYLPYAHSDFIFAIIADELGMLGSVAVIGGFVVFVVFGIQTALAAPDRFGMLVAGGVASWFGVQALVNVGGVTGLMPVTGLTLPFFSAGGSSLFVSMVAVGLLLSVARRIGSTAPRASTTRGAS